MPNRTTRLLAPAASAFGAPLVACGVAAAAGFGRSDSDPDPCADGFADRFADILTDIRRVRARGNEYRRLSGQLPVRALGIAVFIDGVQAGVTPFSTAPPFSLAAHTAQFGSGRALHGVVRANGRQREDDLLQQRR